VTSLSEAYVNPDDRVLDPTLIDKKILERMPQPSGYRMVVLPYKGKSTTEGGIHLLKETVDREALATVVAFVLKMGPLCYNDKDKFGDTPWCEEQQWVLIGRYAGARMRLEDGEEIRIINDDEVIGTILEPNDIVSYK
jgi:co-chaperonin GroES (HSP10)|tara:strand:- start:1752 stop:2165 length:414 start_codon:yes stop_codon:yes gene_type:complete